MECGIKEHWFKPPEEQQRLLDMEGTIVGGKLITKAERPTCLVVRHHWKTAPKDVVRSRN